MTFPHRLLKTLVPGILLSACLLTADVGAAEQPVIRGLKYMPAEAVAAVVVRVSKLVKSPRLEMVPWEILSTLGMTELGIDPLKATDVIAFASLPTGPGRVVGGQGPGIGVVISMSAPITLNEALRAQARSVVIGGQQVLQSRQPGGPSFCVVGGKTLLIGVGPFMERMLTTAAAGNQATAKSSLRRLLAGSSAGDDVSVFVAVEPIRLFLAEFIANIPPLPPPLEFIRKLPDQLQSVQFNINASSDRPTGIVLTATDGAAATAVDQGIRGGLVMAKTLFLASSVPVVQGKSPVDDATRRYFARLANTFERRFQPKRNGTTLTIDLGMEYASASIMVALLLPAVQQAREAARRAQSTNNLKQLMRAAHNFHETYGRFPPQASVDANGKPLLSWRVHLLPYVDQLNLYRQFHLDEPWDSAHNKSLIGRIPTVYQNPNLPAGTTTNYLAVVGKDTVLAPGRSSQISGITDGSSLTLMMVEADADRAVTWTKPADHAFSARTPFAGLGKLRPGGFLAAFADGAVRFISSNVDPGILKAMVTKSMRDKAR